MAQRLERQTIRQSPWVSDLKAIREKHHLHAGVAGIVAMCHSVDDTFGNHVARYLVRYRCLGALGSRAHLRCDLRHHKVDRLVNQLKHRPLVGMVRGYRFGNFGSMEMSALDLRRWKELLRLLTK